MLDMLMRSLAILLVLLSLGGCSKPPYDNVDNTGLKSLLAQGVPIYDIRRQEEWRQTGVIEGSRKLTFVDAGGRPRPDFFPTITREVRRDQPVIVICRTGNRTDTLARELMEKVGYTKVYNVKHGITGWIGEGNPVVKQ
jgi:rhodanese-related sulfurtransferase